MRVVESLLSSSLKTFFPVQRKFPLQQNFHIMNKNNLDLEDTKKNIAENGNTKTPNPLKVLLMIVSLPIYLLILLICALGLALTWLNKKGPIVAILCFIPVILLALFLALFIIIIAFVCFTIGIFVDIGRIIIYAITCGKINIELNKKNSIDYEKIARVITCSENPVNSYVHRD